MNSLPSWVFSPFAFSVLPRMAATTAPPTMSITGSTSTSSTTITIAPGIHQSCPEMGPRLHFHQRTDREFRHADRGARRAVIAEALDVHLVHQHVIAHVAQE